MNHGLSSKVHYEYVTGLLEAGRIRTAAEVAKALDQSVNAVQEALRDLSDNHGVVLHPHVCEPWVIHPFSASPSATWVESGDRGWWAPCIWCACGVTTLAGGEAIIHSRIGGEREDVDIHVHEGRVRESELLVHFAAPPRAAWDNVHHFCATVLPFRSPSDVSNWNKRHGIAEGAVVPISQVMDLGRLWYARHGDPNWRKWTVEEAGQIFRAAGLIGDFWDIPESDGRF
jgi:hypothetical protein